MKGPIAKGCSEDSEVKSQRLRGRRSSARLTETRGRFRGQSFCWVPAQEVTHTGRWSIEPVVVVRFIQDDDHALFFVRLVKALHDLMAIGVDGEHREGQELATIWPIPGCPEAGQAHGLGILTLDAPTYGLAGLPVRLKD